VLQIGGLAAQSGPVVHDLAINFAGCKVNETQRLPSGHVADIPIPSKIGPTAKIGLVLTGFISHRRVLPGLLWLLLLAKSAPTDR
jgi:hypothetical protein